MDCRSPIKWQLLLAKMGVNAITGVEIMDLLVEMKAIDKELWDSKLIWCQNLVNNIADVYHNRKREIPQKPVTTGDNAITTGGNPSTTPVMPQSKRDKTKRNNIKKELGKRFKTFWEAYPKKVSKGQAEKAFFDVQPDEKLLGVMLSAIERAKKSENWCKENGKYIQNPATWLNAKGWEDEIGGNSPSRKVGDDWPVR